MKNLKDLGLEFKRIGNRPLQLNRFSKYIL